MRSDRILTADQWPLTLARTRKINPLLYNLPAYGRRPLRELIRVGGKFTR